MLPTFCCSSYSSLFAYVALYSFAHLRDLPSFPTRRSSDLRWRHGDGVGAGRSPGEHGCRQPDPAAQGQVASSQDRKSTRLNSSHLGISYAVFCLKKKKKVNKTIIM